VTPLSMSFSVDHIQLNVSDVEATACFCQCVFGMRRVRASEADWHSSSPSSTVTKC